MARSFAPPKPALRGACALLRSRSCARCTVYEAPLGVYDQRADVAKAARARLDADVTMAADANDHPPSGDLANDVVLDAPALLLNRETSWLAFNARVLGEAQASYNPPLERLKFIAIHAGNLDEFFMVRVSGLHEQLEAKVAETSPDGLTPLDQLIRIRAILLDQLEQARVTLTEQILPALKEAGIELIDWDSNLEPEAKARLSEYFRSTVFPTLTPLAVDPGHPFPFLSNLSLSLAVEIRDPDTKERKFARVKVPESLPRFVPLDDKTGGPHQRFLPLEQLIEAHLTQLFPELEILGAYPFRVTRDMDFEILAQEAVDLMSLIDRELRKRRFGACVRLEVDRDIPEHIRRMLIEKLEIDPEDVYETSGLLGLSQLMPIAFRERPELRDPPFSPRIPAALAEVDGTTIFNAIRADEILMHHPYDSFSPVLEFLNQAAVDPQVLAVKMTLYRGGSNAEAARALIRAAENGKQVAVLIELKARFDEQNNITWARAMERAGVHVFYGNAGTKTHCKVALVVRREADAIRRYVHLATGNYNPSTARSYTDLGFFTTDVEIGEDVSELFNALSGFSKQTKFRKLAVAPSGLVDAILALIDGEAAEARTGRPARIFAKMNSLVDTRVIKALYRASRAGVRIELVVRGICCLRPAVAGVSENIRVRSIIGRFLEHPRVFVFGSEGREQFFLSSADWMPRNFNERVEVLFPIASERLREMIRREVIEPALRPDVRAYELRADGSYSRVPPDGSPSVCAQALTLDIAANDPTRRPFHHARPPSIIPVRQSTG
jgi:polyphosphate kinase